MNINQNQNKNIRKNYWEASKKHSLIVRLLAKEIRSITTLYKSFNFSHRRQKYTIEEYITVILYVNRTGIPWRLVNSFIHWNSIYKVYVKLNSFGIFKLSYADLLRKYYKKTFNNKLKYISSDSSFVVKRDQKW